MRDFRRETTLTTGETHFLLAGDLSVVEHTSAHNGHLFLSAFAGSARVTFSGDPAVVVHALSVLLARAQRAAGTPIDFDADNDGLPTFAHRRVS